MRRAVRMAGAALALALGISGAATETAGAATSYSFAVIGDIPYGSTQLGLFPKRIAQINADPNVKMVSHVGDIGSGNCSSSYYQKIKSNFDKFVDPLVYTPGDNEWADCHRASVGKGNPLERLATVRSVFFPAPGRTLGQNAMTVTAQAGYKENVSFAAGGLTLATLHIVGSDNDLKPWTGLGYTAPTEAQLAEEAARVDATISQLRNTFASAKAAGSRAVVLLTQADMFAPGTQGSGYRKAFQSIVRALASEAALFQRPVFLFNGDSHGYVQDKPLTTSKWKSFYGLSGSVSNLSRVTIEGASSVNEWVRVNVVSGPEVLQIQRVPFT
ncbi:hypothetical protein E7Y32_13615 [Arthrobacter sp. UKPF54-2]|uniref:hypothetical protein n=1 Tax=Arthrobacter sp. UKPF54-2 TaxID=2600159 RepID=UPI0011B0F916|nr:hypothetical protein [Arthrobacter sp. UKPF54-2]QDY91128.1 hypothetical protein E7Y32_13615 [Arthrobacter sp. UKPF54-2]